MAFEGTLETFSIADILQLIGLQRKTGILTLKNNEEVVTISFYNGMIVTADSIPKKLEDKLGKVLVKTNMITSEQLEEALAIQKRTLQKLGYILVKQGYITQEQLKDALQVQVAQMIYRLFRWSTGEYYFDPKAKVEYDPENMVPMSAESILMEGIQMIDEWPLIQKKIPNFNIVFKKVENIKIEGEQKTDNSLESASEFDLLVEESIKEVFTEDKLKLNKEEEMVYNLVDGKKTVQQIIDRCPITEFHTCKALYELLIRNIIEIIATQEGVVPEVKVKPEIEKKEVSKFFISIVGIVLLLLIIANIIVNIYSPFGFYYPYYIKFKELKSKETTLERMIKLKDAVLVYNSIYNKIPFSLDEVKQSVPIEDNKINDPWGRRYNYKVENGSFVISGYSGENIVNEDLFIRGYFIFGITQQQPNVNQKTESEVEIIP